MINPDNASSLAEYLQLCTLSDIDRVEIEDSLKVNPYGDSFGDGEILFADKIVKARKDHINSCFCCGGTIYKNERHRALREAYQGKAVTTRYCYQCSLAMAKALYDNGEAWEHRINLNR